MLRIIRGTDCYWMMGERRFCRIPLSGNSVDWPAYERQTELIQAADQEVTLDNDSLARPGFRYVQVILDGDVTHADRAFARDLANLQSAATSKSSLWHVWVALTRSTAGTAGTLLKTLAEQLNAPSLDISFALIDEPGAELAEGAGAPRELGDSISELYLLALAAGFSLRLPSCHRCAACDAHDGATGLVLTAEGMPCAARDSRCRCAQPDQLCAALTRAVRTAVRNHIYTACGLTPD